jgi:hypothetical protein
MKKSTTKEETIDPSKGITEMRMTLGHLCQLAGVLAEHDKMETVPDIAEAISKITDDIREHCNFLLA